MAGGEFPVPVVTGATATGLQGVSFVPFGVQLNFTPYITDKDRVRLQVNATVSVRDVGTGANFGTGTGVSTFVPGLTSRSISTTVEMREGQTLAIGGLLQTNLGADTSRVPFFGDLPIGGQAFRFDRTQYSESELVLLVTPELVHALEPKEVPPLPGSDYLEPNDIEFYLTGRLESRRSYDFRSPVMTPLCRMKAYRHCELLYFSGPRGHSDGK
jgi:pilus assembly protein CpaC